MFLPAHVAAGLIVGKATGNYAAGLAGAVLIDLDHLIPYIRHGVLWNMKTFVHTITSPDDPYGGQRNVLHNVFVALGISVIVYFIAPAVSLPVTLGYTSHLFLDTLDGSDYFPFYPSKVLNLRGPVRYFSKVEFVVTIGLLIAFILW